MSWQNPLALLGVLAVALPVLIHLLGRGHAKVHRFPTLRFLDASRLLPTRRTTVHDLPLLLVRSAILALAAVALTQPLWLTKARRRSMDGGLARAIIVDTSASMAGSIDSARAVARRSAAEAQISVVVESGDPRGELIGAVGWLTRQGRRGEIVIVSDFQRGSVERNDLAAVPPSVGIALLRTSPPKADSSR